MEIKKEHKKPFNKSGNFDTLVLAGGGIHGLTILGALQYVKDNYFLENISIFVGTSVGAICSYLLAIGYTPQEIMVYLCTHQILEKMKNFNLVAMLNGTGGTSYSSIQEILEKMTIEKVGKLITFQDLYKLYKKKFICLTHNITSNKSEVLNHETYPDMPCLIGIRLSCNLPFIFNHFKYMGSYYIDGGISNNFPIEIGDKIGDKILGIVSIINNKKKFSDINQNALEYIYYLISITTNIIVDHKIKNISDNCKIIKLLSNDIAFFNFGLSTQKKLELFSSGYEQMKNLFPSK